MVTATRGACGQSAGLRAQAPALYDVEVRHVRHAALHRDFRHRVYLWLVDLDVVERGRLRAEDGAPAAGSALGRHHGTPSDAAARTPAAQPSSWKPQPW